MGKGSAMFGGFFGKRDVVKKAWAGEMARQESMGEAWGEQPPAWLKGAVYKPNNQVGKRLPVAWDGTAGDGKADSSPPIRAGKGDGTGAAMLSAVGGGNNTGVVFAKTGKLRSTLELPEGQVQIMVDPEAARIWGAIREVSETLIEKALLGGEEGLVAKFRQELAVLQIRNPGLLYSDQLCSLLNDLSQIDLAALPRQRAVLALQKLLLTMQELSDMSKYNFETDKLGMGGQDLSALPGSALPDLAIYLQEYKAIAEECQVKMQQALRRAQEAEEALEEAKANGLEGGGRSPVKRGNTMKIDMGDIDADLRRAEIQLKSLEGEHQEKRTRYEELMEKIAATRSDIEELDACIKDGTKEGEALLRQLLQKQNAAAVSVGLGAGDGKATGGGPIRNATSRNLTGLLDSAGAPQWDEEQLAEYVATGAIKMLGPSDPAVMAYLAANRKIVEEQAAKFVVRQFMEMLGISGLEDEVDGAKEFLDGDEEDEDEDHSDDDEDEDEEGEEEDWDSDEDETQRFVRVFLHIPAEGEPCTGIVRATVEAIPYEDGSERKLPPPRRHDKRPPTKSTKKAIMGCIGSIVDDLEAGWDPEAPVEEHQEEEDLSKDTDDAEVQIYKLLAFLQSRMEARGLAIGRLQILWEKLRVPEERRTALLQCWKGVGSKDIAGLHTEVRRLEDKLQRAREAERIAQGKALRNTILLVDQMEPKWMEMQAERVKGKVLKSIPPTNKAAERMMTDELKNAGKAEQRATKKRKELFARFDSANSWTPRLDQQLLKKFKDDHMSLAPTNLAELGRMIEFAELKAQIPQIKPKMDALKRQLKMLKRDRGMDKKTRKAALKLKKEEIKELKVKKQTFSAQLKDAKKSMVGIICMTYLKKAKKETAKMRKKMEAAKTKERQLNLAKETLKKDSKPQMLELERNIWKSAAVSVPLKAAAKAPAQMIEDSNRREWSARSAKEDSASQQSGRGSSARSTGKPVEIDDISILPGTVS